MNPFLQEVVKTVKEDVKAGPKAICSGTVICTAHTRCRHYGIHKCSTFKKHRKHECPHYPDNGFVCVVTK